jgi:hypothetical protein
MGLFRALAGLILAMATSSSEAVPPQAPPSPEVRPICGVPGYVLQTGFRFGMTAQLLPGETPVKSTADMVKLSWKHDEPWGRINNQLQYFVDFRKPETYLGPNHVFEADDLALVAKHDGSPNYGSKDDRPDMAYSHIASAQFITSLTVRPPVIVEFMVMVPGGRGMWPALWLYDEHSGKHDASELDVMQSVYNAPVGERDDRSKVFQYDHGPGAGRTLADPGGLDAHGGWWQPYGPLSKGDAGRDLSQRWVAYSLWWQPDRASKYVDDKRGITRSFKWTGPAWPNILVGNAVGGTDWTGPIFPETFAGDNSTMRIKWIRIFKPSHERRESK